MKIQTRLLVGTIGIVTVLLPSLFSATVLGATSNSITANGNGYRISPVRTDITINPGQSQSVQVYLTDISTAKENLSVIIDDFIAKDESGTPGILLHGQSLPKHGLKQYATPSTKNLSLNPGQTSSIFVNIKIPQNAVPGGYYGAVAFTPTDASGNKNVNLAASVASLILVKVPGNVHEDVSIVGFGAGRDTVTRSLFFSGGNLKGIVRFQNNGDIQEEPFGKILLKKGKATLGSYEVNNTNQRGNVLPGSIRRFAVNLDKVGSFGKYTLEGNFGYGSNGQLLSATSTFYVIPVWLVIIIVALIVLIALGVFLFPKMVRRHDRRILRQSKRR